MSASRPLRGRIPEQGSGPLLHAARPYADEWAKVNDKRKLIER